MTAFEFMGLTAQSMDGVAELVMAATSPDLLKEAVDRFVAFVAGLPAPVLTLPARTAVMLGLATLACVLAFRAGSRSAALQSAIACLVGFLASFVPVEALVELRGRCANAIVAVAFCGAIVLNILLSGSLSRVVVPTFQTQRNLAAALRLVLGVLFVVNIAVAFYRGDK